MKNKLLLLLGVATLVVGCTSDVEGLDNGEELLLTPMIRLDGSISEQYLTRVDDNGFCDGDQIGLYGVNYANNNEEKGTLKAKGNQVDNARYTYDAELNAWNSTGSIYYKDAKTNIDLYAYYPYDAIEDVNKYKFEVQADQSGEGINDGYSMSDFLWGVTPNVKPTTGKVKIRFSHRLANATVILQEGSGFAAGEFAKLDKNVMVSNTKRTAPIDLESGVATATGEVSPESIVMRANNETFRAIVVPQNIAANTTIYVITIDGISYRYKHSSDFEFKAGKQSKFTIKINKKEMTGEYTLELTDCEIVNWKSDIEAHEGEARQYYVVNQEVPGTLGSLIRADKRDASKIKNLKITGKIDARDFGFMRDSMRNLQAVNLKESQIVEGWSWKFGTDNNIEKTLYFSGKMPATNDARWNALQQRYPDFNTDGWWNWEPEGYNADEIPAYAFGRDDWSDEEKSYLVYFSFPEKVTKIGRSAFNGTMLSGALIIPNDVVEIGEYAFAKTNISSLELPHNLKKIDGRAFENCASLSGNLSLPESLESLGDSSFSGCKLLSGTLTIPSKIKEIPNWCFYNCGFTGDLTIPEGVVKIGSYAFHNCNQLKGRLSLPISLREIKEDAFSYCKFQGELMIPSEILTIPTACFAGNEFSSVIFAENSELLAIGERAFDCNWRLAEPIELPNELLTIGSHAFAWCGTIPKITIPVNVTTIGEGAFDGDYGLTSMICEAVLPPTLGANVFNGVGKDNFTLEVPEKSVTRYQSTTGWNDFKRISAHHDFAISRSLMRTLNAEYSKSYLLRAPAEQEWSVKSKPDWVTVTPSNGVGPAEVTITVSEMAATDEWFEAVKMGDWGNTWTESYEGRAGDIVFSLDSKNYTSTMKVEQYDYEHYDGEVITNQTATVGGGVNLVFMGDCFDAQDIASGRYLNGINQAIEYYFAIEPYKTYKEYFNIYTVIGMSPDSGVGTVNTVKDSKFGSQYTLDAGVQPNSDITFEYAKQASTVDESNIHQSLVVMIENTTSYGGVTYMWADGKAIAVCPMSQDAYPYDFRGLVQHEAGGHGFAKLADEYIYHNAFIDACTCCCCYHLPEFYAGKALGWYSNLSTNGDMRKVEWADLIFHPDYAGIVDMYEGGFYHSRGIYRSEATSCMNNNIAYYSAIQRMEMVKRIMDYAGLEFKLDDFYAKDVRDASNNDITRAYEPSATERANASKQRPPVIMGDKPNLK